MSRPCAAAAKRCLVVLSLLLIATSARASQIAIAWDANTEPDLAGYIVEYGPSSAPFTLSTDVGNTTSWSMASATPGVSYTFRVVAYNAQGVSAPSNIVTTTAPYDGPALLANRNTLNFANVGNGLITSAQTVRLSQVNAPSVSWSASSNVPWLSVTPAFGVGSAVVTVTLIRSALPASATTGTITFTLAGASNAIPPVTVTLGRLTPSATQAPVGAIDTPSNNARGITGSIPVTGWAVDDVDVSAVRIFRDPVPGEPGGLVFVGNATLVDGARPDVAAAYPLRPQNTRAGWGLIVLTNMLPNLGNGTFRLHAYADDPEGHSTLIGSRTITCSNATATLPFGAIDTPAPGATISGTAYNNFGWVLSRAPRRSDVPGGGTVTVVIDGVPVGTPTGWVGRSDLQGLFPASTYPGVNNALGVFTFDTTTLANGMHTIAWGVTDDQGGASGIGSRFFWVANGSPALQLAPTAAMAATLENEVDTARLDAAPLEARRGYSLETPFRWHRANADGRVTIQSEELDRIELRTHGATAGYLRAAGTLQPLPIGSHLDVASGTFTWQPGVGFVGSYDLVFVRCGAQARDCLRQDVRVVLNPKGSGRVGMQIVIDTPSGRPDVPQPFTLAGWAADLDAAEGTGVGTVHVWAYPITGADPIFLGVASYGGRRPDVAAVYGDPFRDSGYGLVVDRLTPGIYTLAVFAWSPATGTFAPAKTLQIVVR